MATPRPAVEPAAPPPSLTPALGHADVPTTGAAISRRTAGWLYLVICVLASVPLWLPYRVPTTDGPCHTYNSLILRALIGGTHPFLADHYQLNLAPYPNWTSETAISLLLGVVSPRLAEKAVVFACLWLFLGGAWYLLGAVRRDEAWIAFLAPPFAFNWLFQMGFYNFSLGVGGMLLVIGAWWRHGREPSARFAVAINTLLFLTYFSHVVPFGLALIAIGILVGEQLWRQAREVGWAAADRRRAVRQLAILLPQAPLPIWFFASPHEPFFPTAPWSAGKLFGYLVELRVLRTFQGLTLKSISLALSAAIFTLVAITVARRWRAGRSERSDAFLALAGVAVLVYLAAPSAAASGSLIKERLTLFPFLLVLPGLAPGLGRRAGRLAAAALLLLVAFDLGYQAQAWKRAGEEVERYLEPLAAVRPRSRVVPLSFAPNQPTDYLRHAIDHAAVAAELIDWDNYEAKLDVFPIHFRTDIWRPALGWSAVHPNSLPLEQGMWLIDAIYTWKMPADAPLRPRLERHYDRVAAAHGGELWQRRLPAEPPPEAVSTAPPRR